MPLTYSLDEEQQQLSIDVVELNNVVLAMRPLVKKAKVLVLRELAIYVKRQKVKQSKAPKDKVKRMGRKIVNRLSEIRLLKKLNLTKLCKLVLANVYSRDLVGFLNIVNLQWLLENYLSYPSSLKGMVRV